MEKLKWSAAVWKNGNSLVITIPNELVRLKNIKVKDYIAVNAEVLG